MTVNSLSNVSLAPSVVYDGCPKAYDTGIWWPKTPFGRPVAINCPKGSTGRFKVSKVWRCACQKGLFRCLFINLQIMVNA